MRILAAIRSVVESVWLPIQRGRLLLSGEQRLARALDGRSCPISSKIESLRSEMLRDFSPLADGQLGPPLEHDLNQTVAGACGASRRSRSANVLYSLAAEYRPKTIIELGTNVGISAAYLAAAGGRVTTLDVSRYRLRLAERLHHALELNVDRIEGYFTETLEPALKQIAPVEMAFIDGHHQYSPTLDYFEAIASEAAPGCVFLFDDIRWSSGMRRAWAELRRDSRFETVVDLGGMGIGVLGPSTVSSAERR